MSVTTYANQVDFVLMGMDEPVHVEPEIKSRAGSSSEASTVSTDSEQARSFWQKLDAKASASAANKKKGFNKDYH
jgi:hypothetical protein